MTIRKSLLVSIGLYLLAAALGVWRFGMDSRLMVRSDIPWMVACFAIGFSGTIFLLVSLYKMLNSRAGNNLFSSNANTGLVWIIWLAAFAASLYTLRTEYRMPVVSDVQGLGQFSLWTMVGFVLVLLVTVFIRARRGGWISALSFYALDKKLDERERSIQYQATGITFSLLLVAFLGVGTLMALYPPHYQGVYVSIVYSTFLGAMTIRSFLIWFLSRR